MWECPKCERLFKTTNQSHSCGQRNVDDLFENRPDNLVLTFDKLLVILMDWEPNSVGVAVNTIVFTNKKAWLIIKPMTKELDVKFYNDEVLQSSYLKKVSKPYKGKFAHHIRVRAPHEVNEEVIQLLRIGYDFALK